MEKRYQAYWERFTLSRGAVPEDGKGYAVDEFGDSPELADELVGLILSGRKTATCGLLYEYERDECPLPAVGDRRIVVNGAKEPVCVIAIEEVEIKPYCEVDDSFARDEGEGDRTRASWDEAHRKYFTRVLAREGKAFDDSMLLVCERFCVIHI